MLYLDPRLAKPLAYIAGNVKNLTKMKHHVPKPTQTKEKTPRAEKTHKQTHDTIALYFWQITEQQRSCWNIKSSNTLVIY